MSLNIFKKVLSPIKFIQVKARSWRQRRRALERRLLEVEKITRSMVKLHAWDLRQKILGEPRYMEEKRLLRFGFKAYSQNEEDGIIQEIFRRIGTINKTFIEIGVGNGLENNTLYLLLQGWRGLWIDSSLKFVDFIKEKYFFL